MTLTLSQVQSFAYLVGSNAGELAVQKAIGASSAQLIFAGSGVGELNLNRSIADPNNNKIILGYIDASEANLSVYPQLVGANGALPSWFGGIVFPNQYTVQYWTPAWETAVFGEIDKLAKAGYNGIFIDQVSGYLQFQTGNPYGNANNPNAVAAMATFLTDIRSHINSAAFQSITGGKPFYVVGNNPDAVAVSYPSVVSHTLDGILQELLYYNPSYVGTGVANYVTSTLVPVYKTLGLPVFGNDYPPAGNVAAEFTSFAYYTSLGWDPSADSPTQKPVIFTTGPYEAMAVAGATTVTGVSNLVNFLSGGLQLNDTLIGGDLGDYFIGGPGQNTIIAGDGNDTIYAHPATAAYISALEFKFAAQSLGIAGLPQVQIKVNGAIVSGPTTLTDVSGTAHEIDVDVSKLGTIKSIEVDVLNVKYLDGSDYNTVYLNSIAYNNNTISAASGVLNTAAHLQGTSILFSKNGVASWSGTAIPPAPAVVNTSDTIDGGGGTNTVIYRGTYGDFTITKDDAGALYLSPNDTAEGPDSLTNVQYLQFADQTIATSSIAATNHLFTLPTSAAPTINVTSGLTSLLGVITAPLTGNAYVNGGLGATTLIGGTGDDTFLVFKGSTVITVPVSTGIDTVLFYGGAFALPANVENITLIGSDYAQTAVGNTLNNILTANDFNSTLIAGSGHDILIAGAGINLMIGGAGPDIFQFNVAPSAAAEIQKFVPGQDVLDLRPLFKAIGYTGLDPVLDGHLQFVSDGAGDTKVLFDSDGSAGPHAAVQIAVLDLVAPTSLQHSVDWVFH